MPIEIALPGQVQTDALAVPISQPLGGEGARIVDEKIGGRLQRLVEEGARVVEEPHLHYSSSSTSTAPPATCSPSATCSLTTTPS